jgi:hypothetical protein
MICIRQHHCLLKLGLLLPNISYKHLKCCTCTNHLLSQLTPSTSILENNYRWQRSGYTRILSKVWTYCSPWCKSEHWEYFCLITYGSHNKWIFVIDIRNLVYNNLPFLLSLVQLIISWLLVLGDESAFSKWTKKRM